MKRLFLLALLVLFTLPIFAKHVSVETAQQVARNFWEQNVVKSTDVIFSDVTSQTEFTNFYIFNTDGGFVIVSADDIAYPVLGYSDEGSFNTSNIAINTLEWLRGYQRQIQFGIDNDIKASEEISSQWYKLQNGIPPMHKNTRAVTALLTTKWNQGDPYNLLCPYDDRTDENAVTGCVATALAQVMKYWNYPTRGTGSYSYSYSNSYYGTQSADFENTTYDWNNMPDRLMPYSSQAEKNAVATLMYHCGVAVGMNYGTTDNGGGSAAHTISRYDGDHCTENALKDYFGYKTTLQGLYRDNYTDSEWENMLKIELNARRPVLYSGDSGGSGAGHSFVCDGYNNDNYFHFNWGWGGGYDGFFLSNALTPNGGGIGAGDRNYSYNQDIIIGVEPAGVTVSPEIIEAASAGGNYSATVKAGTAASSWTSTSSASWLTISPTTGAGSEATTQITVTATANTGSSPRTATVTFTHGSTSPTILTVVQPDSYTESCVTMHEDRFSTPLIYTMGDNGYLFGSNTNGTQAYAEVFEATGNSNYDLNSIVFMYGVEGEDGSVTFKVWADNDGVPGGVLASKTVNLSELYAAGNVSGPRKIGYYTWTLNPSIVVPNKFFAGIDVSNATSRFALFSTSDDDAEYANSNYRILGTNWNLYNTGRSMYILPTICPTDAPFYLLAALPSSLEYIADGGSKDITVNSNTNWTATSSANWLTLSPTSGSNNGTITAVAAANTSNGERTATITVSASGVNPQTISVTQADPSECFIAHEDRFTGASTIYTANGGGYVCGNSSNGYQAKAELFELSSRYYNITSIDFKYGVDGEEGSVIFKVWANNNGTPGEVLASKTVTLSELYSAGTVSGTRKQGIYTWTLTTPVTISGNFFAGIDVSNATSYIGLYSTVSGDGYENSCYQLYSNGYWYAITSSWSLDISMYVLPTICPIASYVFVSPSSLNYSADGESKDVTVNSNINWTATTSANWLTITPSSGSGNEAFSVVAAENTSDSERTATITVSGQGAETQTISVTQASPNDCIVLNEERFSVTPTIRNASGGGFVCGKNSYSQACAELFEISDRYYNLTSIDFMYAVEGEEGSVTFKVWANNNGKPGDVLASNTVALSDLYSAGTTVSGTRKKGVYTWTLTTPIIISSNFFAGIDVSNSTSYIGLYSTASGSYTNNCYYQVTSGNWGAISSSWGLEVSTYVLPTICPIVNYVFVSPSSLNYSADGGSNDVTVNSNVNWTATSSENWLTINPASGSGNGAFSVVAAANTSDGERTATITVSGQGAETQTISITQADPNACIVLHEERFSGTLMLLTTSGGYMCGNNTYGDQAKAELFEIADHYYNITSIDFMYGADGDEGSITFKVWADNNGVPGDELASKVVTLSELYSAGTTVSGTEKKGVYTWTLTTPVSVSSNFFAGIDVSTATSTIGLYSTTRGSGYTNSNYELYNGRWGAMSSSWPSFDVSMFVLPTACPIPSYNITVLANNDAYGEVAGGGTFSEGTQVTVSANPATGYNFVNWTENSSVVSTNANYTFTATAHRTLVANFEAITYTVTANANPAAGGSVTGAGSYTYGQTATLTATANTGYHFVNWTDGNAVISSEATYSFTVNGNRNLNANFQINSYTISASANPVAGGTVNGAGDYTYGQTATLTATANTGYNFVNWTENGTAVSTNATYSFTATDNRTLVANFEAISYTITANANPTEGGTVTGAGSYTYGQTATLNATANTGYHFVNWTDGNAVVSSEATYSFPVSGNRNLIANFQLNTYTISASANPVAGGTINGTGDYTHGQTVTLTAIASTGYNFVNWTENGMIVSTNATYSFTATDNRTLVANFEAISYTITANANPTEGGSVSGAGSYTYGQTATLTATANTGYQFINWTDGNAVVSSDATYSFIVNGNRTLVANFQINTYTITANANPVAGGTINGAGNYTHGQTVTLTATASTGYNFVNWTENGTAVSTNATYSFTATDNRTLVANFEAITYTISASASPLEGGTITGAGDYTYGQNVTLNAVANTGYTFVNWTENGTEVSTNAEYTFTANSNSNLVANFQINTYTITVTANPAEYGTVNGGGNYTHGQTVTLNAIANTNYSFVNWTENGSIVSTAAEYSFTATENRTLVANFATITYTITASANPTEGGTVNGSGNYASGQTVNLNAVANTGYNFTNWTENDVVVSTNTAYSFTATADRTLVANFEAIVYNISTSASPVEGGTVAGAGDYNYGQEVTLIATANTGYSFTNWTEDGSVVSTNANYTFTVSANRTMVANFEINTYTISANANPAAGGTVNGAGDYTHGQTVTLTATANTGYNFVNWTENGTAVSTNATYSFTATDNRTLVANFEAISYTISASANPLEGGTITGAGDYTYGQNVTLNAVANTGYTFVNWTENGTIVSTNAEYTFTANSNRNLVANFQINTYNITVTANPTEYGTVSGAGNYTHGQTVTLIATANTDYSFVNWTENGNIVSTDAEYSFTATASRTLVANFATITYTITASASPVAGGTVTGSGSYASGQEVNLSAVANTGYNFTNWTENGSVVSTNADYSFTAEADRTLVANFTLNTYTISSTANPTEGGTIEGADEYSHGETVILRATANTGYTFKNWTEGNAVVSTNAQYSFTATADRILVANFQINTYSINATANPTEGGTIEGADEYSHGETVTLRATANTGYTFTNWTEGNAVVSTDAQYSFSATADRTLVANFEINTYTVTAVADPTEGGTVTIDIPSQNGVYNYGTNLVITATANEGYHFVQWNDGLTTAQKTYMVDANAEFIAYFVQNEATRYIIAATANPREGGTITGTGVYEADAQAFLTATANTGYTFTNWTENGTVVSTNAEYSFTVTTSRTLVANFELNTYTITASANPAEGGTMTGAGEYTHGQMVTLRATANAGYAFINWTENGSVVSNTASYMFEATADRSLVANFDAVTYTINASANPADGGTITGTGNYAYGQNITLTATANDGYIFANWTENGFVVSSDAEYSFTVTSDRTLIANFGATTYSVTASANPTEGGTIEGAGDYVPGQTVYLIATANEGYTFVNWTENGSVVYTNPSYQFTAISDRTLVANFEINTYTIIASANPFAGGTIEGDGNYTYGQTATLTATANTGYEFVNWTEDNEIVSTDTEYSFTVTTNRRLVANFSIGTYTISASANPAEGGTVEGADEYTYGQTATLRATANENYNFTNWTEDNEVVSTDAEYSFTVTADRNLVANFIYNEPAVYTITATANPTDGGTIEGAGVYREGETVSLSASARTGYHFVNWTENEAIVSTNAEYTFTARENRNLVANFQKDRYTVYITKNHLDGGTVEGDGEYEFGETATIIATANENYRFVNWTEAGEELSTEAEYSFEVTRDRYIVANFIYEMSVDAIELGSISVYPNPTSGMFKVEFGSITGDVTCQIVNASGSVIETRELNVTDGSEVVFDCNVAPGVYFVRVISNDRVWTESIVINR